ncbi:MAG TPA: 2'-5' RNA ligase family protein [Terriglobales bacterium]|nr:2'-5' RNA ligase family protein [Terriglobales bacterium]
MLKPQYALVAYVKHPVGEFVESLRRELHPELPHLPAHVTVLPPRYLVASTGGATPPPTEATALETLGEMCRQVDPFEIVLGEVETFVPVTPTVFIRVAHAGYRMRELHERLNAGIFACREQWPYMPHLTIVKMATEEKALQAFEIARELWNQFQGSRRIAVEELTFVRQGEQNTWVDLAPIPLGRSLVSGKSW